jgi:LPS export ABC transporter permease LptF
MRIPRTLSGQVVREILLYSTLGFLVILALLTSQNLFRRLDEPTMIGFAPGDFWIVLRSLLPMLATYAAPISFLLGVMLTLGRMSSDHEVLAMQSCGLGTTALLAPIAALGLLLSGATLYLMTSVEHSARADLVNVFKRTATKGGILEPGRFRMIGPRMIYVEGRDRENRLEGIMIDDHTNAGRPIRIFAERGALSFDEDTNRLRFVLEDGDVHFRPRQDEPETYRRMNFDRFDYTFDIGVLLGAAFSPTRPRQMSIPELDAVIARAERGEPLDGLDQRDPVAYQLERARRFALPMAPLLFALIALPLGTRSARGGRAWGMLLSIAIVLGYYALLAGGQFAARRGFADATLCLWIPNALFALIALSLLAAQRFAGRR